MGSELERLIAEWREIEAKATSAPWASKEEISSYPECDDHDYFASIRDANGKALSWMNEVYGRNLDPQVLPNAELAALSRNLFLPLVECAAVLQRIANLKANSDLGFEPDFTGLTEGMEAALSALTKAAEEKR